MRALASYSVATTEGDSGYQQATADHPFGFQAVAKCMPDGSQKVANGNQATSAPESPEAIRAMQLCVQWLDPSAIVLVLRGIKSSAGRRYQQALAEVLELLRGAVRGATC